MDCCKLISKELVVQQNKSHCLYFPVSLRVWFTRLWYDLRGYIYELFLAPTQSVAHQEVDQRASLSSHKKKQKNTWAEHLCCVRKQETQKANSVSQKS